MYAQQLEGLQSLNGNLTSQFGNQVKRLALLGELFSG